MGSYILKRLLFAPLVLFTLITVSFFLMRLAPGDPLQSERGLDPAAHQALKERYRFDEPLIVQYGYYLAHLAQGDFGPSYLQKNRSVNEILGENIVPSIVLGALALALALGIGIFTGIISAIRQGGIFDYGSMAVAQAGLSIPAFVIGPLLALLFATWLDILPFAGYQGYASIEGLKYLILPAVTLALPFAARIARLCRAGMLDVIHQDFVRTARAKGLSEFRIIMIHCLRGGLIPVLGFIGPATAGLLTGSLVVEFIFQIPGLGKCFVESATQRDYLVVLGAVIVYALFLVVFNLLTDIAYGICDPRVRHEQS